MKIRSAAALLVLALAAASSYAQDRAASNQPHSGFLGDYSKLQPAKDREGVLLYVDRSANYATYTKVMLVPVEVYVAPSSDYKGVQPDVLKRMTDGFLVSFRRALEPTYQVVTQPGPDVLVIRSAITGVQVAKPALKPTDLVPIKAAFNLARSTAGAAPQVAEMTAEMEVLDANSNRLAAAVATRKGDKSLAQGDQITWKHLEAISDYWAKGFRQRLDELRKTSAQ